jgi:chromosome segregation ATPase
VTDPNSNEQNNFEKQPAERRLVAVESRLEAHSKRFESLHEELEEERGKRRELERKLEAQEDYTQELEREIAQLDSRTDLLNLVQSSHEMDGEQRSTVLIQHLYRAAEKRRDRGEPAKSSVNRGEAATALQHPDVERTTIYQDMKRAVRLVGDESVLWYGSASDGEARLKLDLETGELPRKFTEGE